MKLFSTWTAAITLALWWSPGVSASEPGELFAWGNNTLGQAAGVPPTSTWTGSVAIAGAKLTNVVAVAAGKYHCLALLSGGAVVGSGYNYYGQTTGLKTTRPDTTNGPVLVQGQPLRGATAIAAGESHSLALKKDGHVVAWGDTSVPPGLSNVAAIAAGGPFSLALKRDGTVLEWGSTPRAEAHVPAGLSNVIAIACGGGP